MTAARSWYEFKALSEKEAELSIYDEIGGWGVTASAFISDLKKHTGKSLTVYLNSPGGAVTEGNAIFNALQRHKGGVVTQIDGLAASMASYVAMVGAPVRMAQNAYLMIHNPSGGVWGNAEDARKMADLLDKMKASLVTAYSAKSGKDAAEISEAMDAETWFTAEEAKDFGLVDEITDEVKAAASFDLTKFRNAPRVDNQTHVMPTQEQFDAEVNAKTAAQAQAVKNFEALTAAVKAGEEAKAALADVTAKNAELSEKVGKLEAEKEGEPARIAAAITSAQAQLGIPEPVPQPVDNSQTQKKADLSNLTGLEKAIAAHKLSTAK